MSIQSVVRCESYDQSVMNETVARHFEALKVAELLSPGTRALIKPNLIAARKPESAATTHPALIRAVALWLRERGVESIALADSPGGLYTPSILETVYAASGMKALGDVVELNRDTGFQTRACPPDFENASFNLINPVCQADLIIDIAKLKTHSMTRLSAGVKNLFGCIPGLQKPELHYKHPNIAGFSNMLIELAKLVAPQVTLIDAVDCMEGDGPTGGTVRRLGLTLASRDVFAQDWFAATLMGIDPESVGMLARAKARGWLDPDAIELTGDAPVYADPPFILPETTSVDFTGFLPAFLRAPARKALGRLLKPLPKVDPKKCVGCGRCAESCPAHIIRIENHKAKFTAKGCISCFCCQEMCPAHAISVKRIFGGRTSG
ncbi:MAG: DUF362 domain-containing protein [Clostridia bacterium]|nr:DUF362 domain-containing protein [Clostridia bacterium]MBO4885438.1 DUF362 domain-containing protein [Clostridia bacterium]MBR4442467.1 DUF362 domain-containing protein [Clostridia bacterium]